VGLSSQIVLWSGAGITQKGREDMRCIALNSAPPVPRQNSLLGGVVVAGLGSWRVSHRTAFGRQCVIGAKRRRYRSGRCYEMLTKQA
jgi:hypothetical protein